MKNDYKVGSIIEYATFGGFPTRMVKVSDKDKNIKNDRPGFAGVVTEGHEKDMEVWGYDYQITRVVKK